MIMPALTPTLTWISCRLAVDASLRPLQLRILTRRCECFEQQRAMRIGWKNMLYQQRNAAHEGRKHMIFFLLAYTGDCRWHQTLAPG